MRRRFRLGWIDFLVVSAASLAFVAAVVSHGHPHVPLAPPSDEVIQAMAAELGVTADELRHAAEKVPPFPAGTHPTEEQRAAHHRAFAAALALPTSTVDAVFERHAGPPFIHRAAFHR